MNAQDALTQLNQALVEHQLTDWTGGLDNARRRFGVCRLTKKQISISRHLCELNSEAEVRDTILHEIAHALAWERHSENCGHDKRWKAICIEIGARPVACFDDEVIQPKAPWVLVNRETGDVYRTYFKRPTRDWSKVWLRGRKAETYGKLEVRANTETTATGDLFSANQPGDQQTADVNPDGQEDQYTKSISRFTARSVADIRQQLLAHAEALAAEHGLSVSQSRGRYSDRDCDLTLTFSIPKHENDEDVQRLEFEALAGVFELGAHHYLKEFRLSGRVFRLIGFKPNNRKYPVIGIDENGKKYKFERTVLDQVID